MEGAMGAKKVVVIQDATRDVSWSAIRWVLHNLPLEPGDELILVGVLHQVNNPSTLSFMSAGKKLVYKSRVDSISSEIVQQEVSRKMDQYHNNEEKLQLFEHCQKEKIKFDIKVHAGHSPKVVALRAAVSLKATWVILDRQMKKDKKFFMEKLSCGISRMKRDNTIEQLRGPKAIETTKMSQDKSSGYVSYGEMIPGSPKEELSPEKSPSTQVTTLGTELGREGEALPRDIRHYKLAPLSKSSTSLGNPESSSSSFSKVSSSSFSYFQDDEKATDIEHEGPPIESTFLAWEQVSRVSDRHTAQENQSKQEFPNAICSVCKNRRPKAEWKKDFTYRELQEATDAFSEKNFLSEGGFGRVYKGELKNGLKVAVKQRDDASLQGEKEFKSEVHVLSKARHKNLVMLLGSCSEGSHRLLVYEFVCSGSLDQHLSTHARIALDWDKRIKIALGAAEGLEFLHENNIIHRDMRPNNILVTHDHESLLGDFGLARNQYDDPEHSSENRVVGTLGYFAPEYVECGKASTKTDVYSFGVVLLQLITGLRTTEKELTGKSLVEWAKPLLKERNYPNLIDKRIRDSYDVHQLFWMVLVAEKCLRSDPNKRYTMAKVVNALRYIIKGNTTCIKDFSPTQSDSVNSATESTESQDDAGKNKNDKKSFDTEIPSTNSTSAALSTSLSKHTSARRKSISASSGRLFSDRDEVNYDEMILDL